MKSILICIIIIFSFIEYAFSQHVWTKTFGGSYFDYAKSVQQTLDGGYIIAGSTGSFDKGSYDIWIIKTDAFGDTIWTKTFGGIYWEQGYDVQETSDGGYIVAGITESFSKGASVDAWLIKLNSAGDSLWTKTYGGTEFDMAHAVQQTLDEGYIIAGYTLSFGAGNFDAWLIKTDTFGDTLWTKTYGRNNADDANSIQQTLDEGYIIAGTTTFIRESYYDFDVWLLKTDSFGDTLWTKTYERSHNDYAYSVLQTLDKGYIIVGETESIVSNSADVWIIKTDSCGDTVWTKTYGGSGHDKAFSIQPTVDDGYIIAGITESFGAGAYDIWLLKTNSSGDTLWTKTCGGTDDDHAHYAHQTIDKGYIIAGHTHSFGVNGDVWIIKTDSSGNTILPTMIIKQDLTRKQFELYQNYPNPFNTVTTIHYNLHKPTKIILGIYNLIGEEIRTFENENQSEGHNSIIWDGTNNSGQCVSSGVYIYQIKTPEFIETRKCILLR
jgi:hypothetical protein